MVTNNDWTGKEEPVVPVLVREPRGDSTRRQVMIVAKRQHRDVSQSTVSGQCDEIRCVRKRVASLEPSPENTTLYRAASDDPEILTLAHSIKKNGLLEPLVITRDNFIVSGHRRHAALKLIGQSFATCKVLPIRREQMTSDQYIEVLREWNRQRNKTVAEQIREEMVDLNSEEAYQRLREARDKSVNAPAYNGVRVLRIEGSKRRFNISGAKSEHVAYIKQVIFTDRKDYWPLSVRGIHYPLLNYSFMRNTRRKIAYKNDDQSYQATSDLLTRMRLSGSIPWEALDDGTRPLREFLAFRDARQFVRQEVRNLFAGYWRDLLQSQPNHIEVLCEKNTIFHMVLRVTERYQIPTSSGRGFNSIDPWHDLFERYRASSKQRLIVIVLSDFDPEGELIPQVGGRTLRDDFGVEETKLQIIKAGVTREQIAKYSLPPQNFAKERSSNFRWFVERNNGANTVYELEALDPGNMLSDLDDVIRRVIDTDLFNREVDEEKKDAVYLESARRRASCWLQDLA
jgi:hypothetical protein